MAWLNQQLINWKPAQNKTMGFGVVDARASYGAPERSYNTMSVEAADTNMLVSSKASCVRVDINFQPWLQDNLTLISKMDAIVNNIRSEGMCLILVDAGSQTFYKAPLTWSEFKEEWVQRVETLAARYQPNFYIVVKEPGWYVPMVSDATTNPLFQNATDWLVLTNALANAVLSVSPSTKVGVSVSGDVQQPAFYTAYLTGLRFVPGVSFIGFDLYTTTAFTSTALFLSEYGSQLKTKSWWIAEAWSGSNSTAFNSSRASLDKDWMLVLYYFAQMEGMSTVIPFFTDCFADYSLNSATNPTTIVNDYTHRQPVFQEFQALATKYGTAVS